MLFNGVETAVLKPVQNARGFLYSWPGRLQRADIFVLLFSTLCMALRNLRPSDDIASADFHLCAPRKTSNCFAPLRTLRVEQRLRDKSLEKFSFHEFAIDFKD